MKTEHKFAVILKSMMAEKPLDEISVMSLCRRCKVNRQTFYYHFHDIYDLLTLVFLSEKIEGIDKCSNFNELVESVYSYYIGNQKFIDATLNSAGKDLFVEFIYNTCYQATLRFLNDYEIAKYVSPNDKKNVARFYASAFSNSIIYYLSSTKKKSLDGLLKCFSFVNQDDLLQNLSKLARK